MRLGKIAAGAFCISGKKENTEMAKKHSFKVKGTSEHKAKSHKGGRKRRSRKHGRK